MNKKTYALTFHFPGVLAKHAYQNILVKASNPALALKSGFQQVRKRDGIARRQLSRFTVSLVVSEDPREEVT